MLRFEVQHYWMSEYVHVQLNGIPLLFCSNLKIQGNQAILRGIDPRVHIQNAGGQRQVLLKLPPSPPIFFHFRDGSINNGMAPVICTPSLFSLFPLLFGSMLLFFFFFWLRTLHKKQLMSGRILPFCLLWSCISQ